VRAVVAGTGHRAGPENRTQKYPLIEPHREPVR
jgi:hypothetical protein